MGALLNNVERKLQSPPVRFAERVLVIFSNTIDTEIQKFEKVD